MNAPKRKAGKVVVKQDEENMVARPVFAQAIVDMSKSLQKLLSSGLNRKAVVVLVAHDAKISKRDVEDVLVSLEDLAKTYCTK